MALNKPLNYESRIAWIDRHVGEAESNTGQEQLRFYT